MGASPHTQRRAADARRDRALERAGYRVLRLDAALVMSDLAEAVARVRGAIERVGSVTEVTPGARFAVNDPRAAVEVARRGLGFVLAPLDAVPAGDPELVQVTTDIGEPEPAEIYAVYPSRRLLPLRVKLALEWVTAARPSARAR